LPPRQLSLKLLIPPFRGVRQKNPDTNAFGLDYLISSEEAKHCTRKRIWEYNVILQSNEQDPDTGVPDDTKELLVQFFSPQNKKSLTEEYSETGYHLVTFDLRLPTIGGTREKRTIRERVGVKFSVLFRELD